MTWEFRDRPDPPNRTAKMLLRVVGVVLVSLAVFTACVVIDSAEKNMIRAEAERPPTKVGDYTMKNPPMLFTDPETKCQYFIHSGITPRYDATGKPMCGQ